jgi:carbamoyl-phosphate synthase small subunit
VEQNLICISDVDTRALVSYIRDNGAMNAVICTDGSSNEDLKSTCCCARDERFRTILKVSTKRSHFGYGDKKYKK